MTRVISFCFEQWRHSGRWYYSEARRTPSAHHWRHPPSSAERSAAPAWDSQRKQRLTVQRAPSAAGALKNGTGLYFSVRAVRWEEWGFQSMCSIFRKYSCKRATFPNALMSIVFDFYFQNVCFDLYAVSCKSIHTPWTFSYFVTLQQQILIYCCSVSSFATITQFYTDIAFI